MYAAASAITPKHASSPYIHGRAASAGPPDTREWTNPTRQTRTATVNSAAPERSTFGIWPSYHLIYACRMAIKLKLGDLLVKDGLISESDLRTTLAQQRTHGGRLGEHLVR